MRFQELSVHEFLQIISTDDMNDLTRPNHNQSGVTHILARIQGGDESAAEELWPLVYDQLRRLANAKIRKESHDALKPTELVHEAYLKLVDADHVRYWNSRGHFFSAAAEAMRRILVDTARARGAIKRGANANHVNLDENLIFTKDRMSLILCVDDALTQLEKHDSIGAALIKLRFFGGMSHQEAARLLGLTRRVADRHWVVGRTWLYKLLGGAELSEND